MQKSSNWKSRRGLLLTLSVLGLLTAIIAVPSQFHSKAVNGEGLFERTSSLDPSLPNYDIRMEKGDEVESFRMSARQSIAKDASAVADVRDGFVRGENALRTRVPGIKFEYNTDLRIPEVITPDVWAKESQFLSASSSEKRSEILRGFVRQNNELIGVTDVQAGKLRVIADYTNPSGNMSFADLGQFINDVPVFRGEIKAGFTTDGKIVRVINNLAPGLDHDSLNTDFRSPLDAAKAAYRYINQEPKDTGLVQNEAASNDLKTIFGAGDWATTAEKMYFPTEPGVAVPAWRVTIWLPINAYMVIVDAATGTLLWRKNATNDQTAAGTYQIYRNSNSFIGAHDSPAPLSPGPVNPGAGTQGALLTRSNVTLVGNEAPFAFNNLGWMTDGTNLTDGNNVQAGVDRDGVNGVDAALAGDTGCPGAGCRVFTSTWNPPPGNPAPGQDPLNAAAQRGAVIQMWYVMNRYHDELYRLGFNEQARNYQHDNFGRGGLGNDRISAEGQDSASVNNANFSIVADGTRGRMQMYLWNGPTPDYDGTADAEIIIHEVTHGVSQRLHGNAAGLTTNMAAGLGEGWGDWYAYTMLAEPSDPTNGIYTMGGYATFFLGGMTSNYYHGIRRFPRAPITFTGGPGNKPHNPFTFKHLNGNCDTTLGTTGAAVDSAFPRNPVISTNSGSQPCDQLHNAGEIWSSMLWEVRNRMVGRLGFAAGTTRVLQIVTDAMKLSPLNPTFLQARDAVLTAAGLPLAPDTSADVLDVREGFRVRGMGFSATIQNTNPAQVTEAFDVPNAVIADPIIVSDSTGDNDGFPEPGENITVTVPINNIGNGSTINNVTAAITGGGNANYGNIADGATVLRNISYTVPAMIPCGTADHTITITGSSSLGALNQRQHTFEVGVPIGGAPTTFTSAVATRIPGGGGGPGAADVYPNNISVAGLTGNKKIKLELTNFSSTYPGDVDLLLVGPGGQKFVVMSDVVSNFSTQTNAVVVFKDSAAATLPVGALANMAGEWKPTNHTDSPADAWTAPAPAGPYSSPAPSGAATFASVFGTSGAAMNGTWSLYGVDDVSGDFATISGWKLTFESADFICEVTPNARAPFDFDGDNKTDVSIYRPSVGQWWYLKSSDGSNAAAAFGSATDRIVPADYTGDLKTDIAIWRPSTGEWFVLRSENNTFYSFPFGANGDVPVSADYDDDGKADAAVFRSSSSTWFVNLSAGGTLITTFGAAGDLPVAADYDGDGKADMAIFRPSLGQWWLNRTTAGVIALNFGASGDRTVPGDYTGDGKADVAYYRPSSGTWFVLRSEDFSFYSGPFGTSTDSPSPGDYDGDGKFDFAVFRPSAGTWFVNRSSGGTSSIPFGINTDLAVPNAYVR